jgi:Zn-dependent protease
MEKSHEIRLAHELAHSLVAARQGQKVSRVTLFILGGVVQITEEPKEALKEFRMAFVGPLSSLGLAVFNLLPGFSMDGGRIFRSILRKIIGNLKRATRGYDQVLIKTAMQGMKVRDLMTSELETISSDRPVQPLADDNIQSVIFHGRIQDFFNDFV